MKILYFDVETTGTDPRKHSIIQLSGIVEIDGEIKEEFDFRVQPDSFEDIDPEALLVNGITIDELKTFERPEQVYKDIIGIFETYIDKFDKNDKFYPAGQNVGFDIDFLAEFFKRRGDDYFGSWQNWRCIDSRFIANFLIYSGMLEVPDTKLITLCQQFGIEFGAHDSMEDIRATRELIYRMKSLIKK
jgi:DNA polymerase-3 subunit epsilon